MTIKLNATGLARSFTFCASTGRTATMFLAKTLNALPDVVALHEGHLIGDDSVPHLPLINFQNRRAWTDPEFAAKTIATLRSQDVLEQAAGEASHLVDIAFNNAPFFPALSNIHPDAKFIAIFRRCEAFVRSATIVSGEDTQPAGWPDRAKSLTDREKFVSLGRLKPGAGSEFEANWDDWTAIQRNIWLWFHVNTSLLNFVATDCNRHKFLFEDLTGNSDKFWAQFLDILALGSTSNLEQCVEKSKVKSNQRASYQIGPMAEWTTEEQSLYDQLALPLEVQFYDG